MNLAAFLQQRRPEWRRLEEVLQRIEGSGLAALDEAQAVEFGRLYRRAASDLNQAQTFVSGEATVHYLNQLVARSYLVIYGKSRTDPWALVRDLFWGYPAVFRRFFGYFLLALALFSAGTLVGFLASYLEAEVARGYLLPADFPMIQPDSTGRGEEAATLTTGELAGFSSFLFTHNVSVTLAAFALGITLGVGTAWLMFYNGIVLGALAAVFVEAHQFLAFATGVLPHGVLEIPACLLGGAAGFLLARGLVWARPWPRREELARTGPQALLLVAGCLPLLAVAALLEAGVARAPDWFLGSGLKLAVAGMFGLLFVAYVALGGWGTILPSHAGQRRAAP
jgi:uncharacterized membrane protein SpoIIM required for sporulation